MELTTTSIDRLRSMQSRTIGLGEFNFDQLTAPPLMSILDVSDITKLEDICTSIRYSGNLIKKKKAIQKIMVMRGFDKAYLSGTNRLTFKFPDDHRIVAKVAFGDVGRHDNPREFFNQHVLKPFITKVFEVAGDGTVGLVERAKPILTREEFLSVADDVFKVIWLITKRYIMADVGSNYFMNWAWRENFGVVLLDFPYLYEPDGDKLVCHAKDMFGNICGGLIDYDSGFNNLVCTKCGVKYNASEIAKILKDKEVITRERGNVKMKVGIVRGNQKTITLNTVPEKVGDIKPEVKNIQPTNNNNSTEKTGRKIVVNVSKAVKDGINKKDAEARGNGKASIKYAPKGSYRATGKKTTFNPNNINRGENKYKVKVNRGAFNKPAQQTKSSNTKKNNQIQITAVTLDELKDTKFNMSELDAENQVVVLKGVTSKGTNVSLCVDSNTIPWDEFDIKKEESTPEIMPEEYKNAIEELEKAKTDLLRIEEEKIKAEQLSDELTQKVTNLEEQLRSANNTNNEALQDEINKMQLVLNERNQTIDAMANEAEQVKKELSTELQFKESEIERLTKDIEELLNSNDSTEKDNKISQMAETITALQNELEEVGIKLKDKEEEISKSKEITPKNTEDLTKYEGILGISLLTSELRYTKDLADLSKAEDPDNIPEQVLVFPMNYEEDGKIVSDYLRDQDNNILSVYAINDVPMDRIKFEEA